MRLSLILLIWLSYTVGSQVVKSSNGRRLSKTTSVSTRRHHKGARPGSRQYANVQKLPKSLKPIAYDIKLNSLDDLSNEQLRLNAEVTIGLRAVQSTNVITFHLDLNVCRITGAKIQGPSDPFPKALSTQYLQDYQNNVVSYNVPSELVQQLNYNLTLAYNCFVNSYESDQVGLYFYYAGADRYLVTNDEPFYAREWLPCWDEPEYKAKFRFLISSKLLQPGQIALTNGVYEGTNSDGFLQFSSTPPISSYLVAFTTGKYTSIQRSSSGGVSVTAWYPPRNNQASLMAGYYAAAAVRQLDMMTDYTGLKFNGPKLDVLFTAMSDDGMENWGLITQNIDTTSKEQLEFTAYHGESINLITCYKSLLNWVRTS